MIAPELIVASPLPDITTVGVPLVIVNVPASVNSVPDVAVKVRAVSDATEVKSRVPPVATFNKPVDKS